MKAGDPWNCPRCGRNSFLKKESILQGWTKTGDVLKCAACGAVAETIIQDASAPEKNAGHGGGSGVSASTDALAALLGGESLKKTANPLGRDWTEILPRLQIPDHESFPDLLLQARKGRESHGRLSGF